MSPSQYALVAGNEPNLKVTALLMCADRDRLELAKLLLDAGADVNAAADASYRLALVQARWTALHFAAGENAAEAGSVVSA